MVIRRIEPMSAAKLMGTLYALCGLLFGAFMALFAMAGTSLMPEGTSFGAIFGIGAIIILPILYGVVGFIMTLIMAAIYNLVAGWVGGVEVQTDQEMRA